MRDAGDSWSAKYTSGGDGPQNYREDRTYCACGLNRRKEDFQCRTTTD